MPEAPAEAPVSAAEIAAQTKPFPFDLDRLRGQGSVRVLVAANPTDYRVDRGRQRGAVVDAGAALEKFLNTRTDGGGQHLRVLIIPTPLDRLIASLTLGHGDIIAGRFAMTLDRDEIIAFSEPIRTGIREVLVTGPGVPPMVSLEDVAGRSIHVAKGSDHHASLTRLNAQLAKVNKPGSTIVARDASLTDEALLRMVNDGTIPITVADDHVVAAWRPTLGKIAVNPDVSISQDGIHAWAVRKNAPQLLALVNEFITTRALRELDTRIP